MRLRQRRNRRRFPQSVCGSKWLELFSDTKVQNLGLAPARYENIGGLDVAMDYATGVRSIQRIRDLDA